MNTNQNKKLKAFASVANWTMIHAADEKAWEEFIAEARRDPKAILPHDVFSALCALGCPRNMASDYDAECDRRKWSLGHRAIKALLSLFRCLAIVC